MPNVIIKHDRQTLEISPTLGAGIVDWSILSPLGDRTPILRRGLACETNPEQLGLFIMGPWTNRIRAARFSWNDRQHTLKPNHSDGTAIHGILRDHPFRIVHRSPISAVLRLESHHHQNWPWPLEASVRYELLPNGLEISLQCINHAHEPLPMGCGLHPYFMRRLWCDDDTMRLSAPTIGRYPCEHCLPTADALPDDLSANLRKGNSLRTEPLDDVFRVDHHDTEITWDASRVRLRISSSTNAGHIVIYAPQTAAGPAPWFCVEPTTMVNDGFNLLAQGVRNTGVQIIEPGASLTMTTSLIVESLEGNPNGHLSPQD
ncbi:MAG: hypothetical protein KF757_03730 [Phycisphaeraceae bacterium]|nr:hypothetical protein [Phycisphaeraceae bacterium]MCW5763114.1 hypothetical protein [Phycisphaeraceae bacterium]